ncbi:MAG: hypothetical protein ACK4UU_02205 [Fimbriimonadales bacterium]
MPVYTVRGKLLQGRIVELETPLPLESADVEVVISVAQGATSHDWREALQQVWASLDAAGHAPPTPEAIESWLRELRAERETRNAHIS